MNGASNIFGRGLSFPLRVGADGRLSWSEGEDNIRQSIELILKTEPGERVALTGFGTGLAKFLFEPNNTSTHARIEQAVADALARWEPRITVETIDVAPDPSLLSAALATITYRLVATGVREQTNVSIPIGVS